MSTALLCPGQGAQTVGMGVAWADRSLAAARVFERCSEALGFDLLALCRVGPAKHLRRTDVSQPAILATSAASLAAWKEEGPAAADDGMGMALGLSLGEYTALYAAGVLTLEDAVKLVRVRGEAMQAASERTPSGMTSILGATREEAEAICEEAREAGGVCVVANLNSPNQVVISGDRAALELAEKAAAARGFRRTIRLDVAGAFHSPLMEPARERLEAAIAATPFSKARYPVVANATGEPATDPGELRRNLVRQLTSPVLFEASLRRALADGADRFLELSPGRVLTGLVKKVQRGIPVEALDAREGGTR